MGKPTKRHTKKSYRYNTNRRKLWKAVKKLPEIKCKEIKETWDKRKSVARNLAEMGLSDDPNKTIHINSKLDVINQEDSEATSAEMSEVKEPKKQYVAKALEDSANQPTLKTNKLSVPDAQFCAYMLEKYGDDYKAMSRDAKNYYQETASQIKKKINMYKTSNT